MSEKSRCITGWNTMPCWQIVVLFIVASVLSFFLVEPFMGTEEERQQQETVEQAKIQRHRQLILSTDEHDINHRQT